MQRSADAAAPSPTTLSQSLFIYKRSNTTDQVMWQEVGLNPEMVHDPLIPEEFAV